MKTDTQQTALTVVERAVLALGATDHEKKLITLAQQSKNIIAITNPDSYKECHSARMALKNERVSITNLGKAARDDANAFAKAVIAQERKLVGIIEPEEKRLQTIQEEHDAIIEREKAAVAAAEAARIANIQDRIAQIVACPGLMAGKTSQDIDNAFTLLQGVTDESWAEEFTPLAKDARQKALETLALMRDGALAQEQAKAAEEARIHAEREELAKFRAEQAERDRQERARLEQEARERENAERLVRQAREVEEKRVQALRDAETARIKAEQEAEAKRLQDLKDEQDRRQAAIDAEEKRQAAERQRLADAEEAERQRLAGIAAAEKIERDKQITLPAPANRSEELATASHPGLAIPVVPQGVVAAPDTSKPTALWQAAFDNAIATMQDMTVAEINLVQKVICQILDGRMNRRTA